MRCRHSLLTPLELRPAGEVDRLQSCVFCFWAMWSAGPGARRSSSDCRVCASVTRLDFVVVNGENAAGGFGITEPILMELLDAGADVVTTGNHVFDQREALVFIERQDRLLRPINFPPGTPGKGAGLFKAANGADVLVINAQGRVFMADLDDPFRAVERELEACGLKTGADAILIDFHAEATSEKEAMGYFVDGRASCGDRHAHPCADGRRADPARGTAYISDAGMCGDFNSVLGMDKEEPLQRFLTKIPSGRFSPALGRSHVVRRRHRGRTIRRGWRVPSRRSDSAAGCRRPSPPSGSRILKPGGCARR